MYTISEYLTEYKSVLFGVFCVHASFAYMLFVNTITV